MNTLLLLLKFFIIGVASELINNEDATYYKKIFTILLNKTFLDYQCLNIHISETCNNFYEKIQLFKHLHDSNFTFLMHNKTTESNDEYCGYVFVGKKIAEMHFLKDILFDSVPRVLFIINKLDNNSAIDLYKKEAKIFKDKDVLLAEVYNRSIVLHKQSRYQMNLTKIEFSDHTFFIPRFKIPKFVNYGGKLVNVVTFHCPIFNSIHENELADGVETRIFREIIRKLNLTAKLLIPKDGKRWGTAYPNKTINGGILKTLYKRKADIGFCSLWIEISKFSYILMSRYWSVLCLTFLIPKPKIIPTHWSSIFKPLPYILWGLILLATLITTTICSILHYAYSNFILHNNSYSNMKITSIFFTIVGMLVMSKHPDKKNCGNANNHLLLWWSVFAMVLTTLYSSSLVSHLTYPQFEPMIDTIEGLVKAGYYWGTPYDPPITHILDIHNSWHAQFANRFKYETEKSDRLTRIRSGNYSVFVKCVGNKHFMELHEIPTQILHDLRTSRTCLNYFLLGFGFRKNLPYANIADRIIKTLVESGITNYWLNRVFEKEYPSTTFAKIYEYKTPPEDLELKSLSLLNLLGAFYVLAIGMVLSILSFIAELFIK